jgi:hypothetical protein
VVQTSRASRSPNELPFDEVDAALLDECHAEQRLIGVVEDAADGRQRLIGRLDGDVARSRHPSNRGGGG